MGVPRRQPHDRPVEVLETVLRDPGGDLPADPAVSRASCMTSSFPVLRTDALIAPQSSGSSVRRSITSMSTSFSMSRAAFIAAWSGGP